MINPHDKYKDNIIFEDDFAFAVHLKSDANSIGHIKVFPKEALTNLEDLSEDKYVRMFTMASLAATLIWENAYNDEVRGTNIFMQSGVDAIGDYDRGFFECVLREPNDGLNNKWEHKEPDFSYVDKLKDETFIMQEMEKQGASKENADSEKKPQEEKPKQETPKEELKQAAEEKEEVTSEPAKKAVEEKKEIKEESTEEVELKTPTQYYKERIASNQKLRNQERSP